MTTRVEASMDIKALSNSFQPPHYHSRKRFIQLHVTHGCKLLIEHDGEHVATKHSINYRKQYQVLTTDDDFIAFEKNDKTAYQSILPDTLSDVFTFGGANREWNSKRIDE